jgi:HEAT repeat protein
MSEGDRYWVQERTLQGTAGHAYTLRVVDGTSLERRTEAYFDLRVAAGFDSPPDVDVSGRARFDIDDTRGLQRVEGREQLRVATAQGLPVLDSATEFRFEFLRSEPASAPSELASWPARDATSILASARLEAQLLEQRIAGLDGETLLATLAAPAYRNGSAEEARFLWRATGLLERDPKLSRKLLAMARGEGFSPEQRARAVDLLTSVGHEEAQAVLREAFVDPGALVEGDVTTRHLYQRLGLLERPDAATAQMVAEHYRQFRADGDLEAQLTSAYSLGAMVASLSEGDDAARGLAADFNAMLVDDLRRGGDATVVSHRVAALGNARRVENVSIFSDLASHESGPVRARVAEALGKLESEAPPEALIELLGDADPVVQRSAVRASAPDGRVYRELAAEASAGGVAPLNVRPILDLVKRGRAEHPEATERLLDALIDRGIEDDRDRELAYQLRER